MRGLGIVASAYYVAPGGGAGPAVDVQHVGWSSNFSTVPALTLPSNLTNGSVLWCVTAARNVDPSTPTDTGSHTWTRVYTSGLYDSQFYISLWTAPNTSTGSCTVTAGVTSSTNDVRHFVGEVTGGAWDDVKTELHTDSSNPYNWGPTAAMTGNNGLAISIIATVGGTDRLQLSTPTESMHHDSGVSDGNGTHTSWSYGSVAVNNGGTVTAAANSNGWEATYYTGITFTFKAV